MSNNNVHKLAQVGFDVGTDHYNKSRPSYPIEALSALHDALPSKDVKLNILELGSGTGIFTRALLAHPTLGPAVGQLRAVEPSKGMRETFSKSVNDERVSVHEGTFEKTGVPDGWADLVIVAQAWHWCPDFDKAITEIARSLKPSGIAVFIWNLEDRDGAQWVAQLRNVIEAHEQGSPQFRLGLWRATFEASSYLALFQPPEEKQWAYTNPTTLGQVQDRALSKSYTVILDDAEKKQVAKKIEEVIEKDEKKVWIDKEKGVFEYPYKTYLVVMHQK